MGWIRDQDAVLSDHAAKIDDQNKKLEELTIRIEDTEAFVNEIAEVAYERAVESVTAKVIEETHNMDFELIEEERRRILQEHTNSPQIIQVASHVFDRLLKKFSGFTKAITEKLNMLFKNPEQKEKIIKEIRQPIKKSVLAKLNSEKARIAAQRRERSHDQTEDESGQDRTSHKEQQAQGNGYDPRDHPSAWRCLTSVTSIPISSSVNIWTNGLRILYQKEYKNTDGYVFCCEDGHPYDPNYITKKFRQAMAAFGRPEITLHKLRHICTSRSTRTGTSRKSSTGSGMRIFRPRLIYMLITSGIRRTPPVMTWKVLPIRSAICSEIIFRDFG